MTSLSSRRKESSTAFFAHSFVTHLPPVFSATRKRPLSSNSIVSSTASRTSAFAFAGVRFARSSQTESMIFWSCSMAVVLSCLLERFCEVADARSRFCALVGRADEGDTHAVCSRIHAVRVPREIAPREHRDGLRLVESARELGVRYRRMHPQIERRVGHFDIHHRFQDRDRSVELLAV